MNPEGSPQAAWMLLSATCLSSFSRGVFQHFLLLGRGLLSLYFESIGLLKSKSINPLMVSPPLQILRLSYLHTPRWKGIK